MSTWPASVKNFLQLQNGVDYVIAQHPNDRGDEITALMTYLGSPGNVQSKLAALNRLFKYQMAPLPKVTWIDADTIEIEACAVAMHSGNDYVFKENTSALQIALSADLDTGSEAADTWYDVFLIGDSSGSTYTAKFVLQGNTPSGATYYKKIFAVRNDGSSNILKLFQHEKYIALDVPIQIVSATSAGAWSSAISAAAAVPAISTRAVFGVYAANGASAAGVSIRPNGSTWIDERCQIYNGGNVVAGFITSFLDSSQQIQYRNDAGDTECEIHVCGFYINIR